MIEAEFGFFEMQVEGSCRHAIELGQSSFCIAPEALDSIDVSFSIGELIGTVIDPQMLAKTDIDQSIIASPAIGMDHRIRFDMTANDRLQRGFGTIRHDFGVDLAMAFEQAEHDRFAISATAPLTANPACAEIRFIDFHGSQQRRLHFASLSDPATNLEEDCVDRADRDLRQGSRVGGREIHGETPDQLSEFGLADSRTFVIPVFNSHLKKLSHFTMCLTS
jgi:hypothetical protein